MIDPSDASRAAWRAAYSDLDGKTVYISGGASGIGASMVAAFALQGAQVAFCDIDAAAGEALIERLGPEVRRAPVFHAVDVTDLGALKASIDAAYEIADRLDALVNNAASDKRHEPEEVTEDFWDWNVNVNLRHAYFASQRAYHWMQQRGAGSIINFGSVAPRLGLGDLSVYSAMKSAVTGMTRSLSRRFAVDGVRVNAIVPGAILTPRQLKDWISPADEARIIEEQHLHRRLVGDDIAPTALFLASDASNAITSQCLAVDGGLTAFG